MAKYAILVDDRYCIGCNTCFYKCVQENRLHEEASRGLHRTMAFLEKGEEPGKYHHRCMHCEDPVCAAVCTTGAMSRSDYGAVLHEPDICIVCQSCVLACPYKVPQYDEAGEGIVKCSMCAHRVVQGQIPACVEACPTDALEFGEAKAIRAKAEKIAAEEGLFLYGIGTNLMVLTTKEPTSLGYPKAPVVSGKGRTFLGGVLASLIDPKE
ncbi:MAG: 4Fe-4S dicluster domain-containing protein [Limnochordia bacterium]|jgi:Fe-S-cluster-containing dehydrogenase component|nr:hypothetical protein [Bacillota bacterium]